MFHQSKRSLQALGLAAVALCGGCRSFGSEVEPPPTTASALASAGLDRKKESSEGAPSQVSPKAVPLSEAGFQQAESSEIDLNVSAYSTVTNRYVVNGLLFYDGPSLQSGATLSGKTDAGTFFLDFWNHASIGSRGEEDFTELDVTAGFSTALAKDTPVGDFSLTLEHASFLFPDESDDIPTIHQLRGGVNWDNAVLPTYLKLKWQYDEFEALYGELGVQKPFQLTEAISLTPSLSLGTALDKGEAYSQDGLLHLKGGVGFGWQLNANTTLTGFVDYIESFENDDVTGVTAGFGIRFDF